MELATVIAHLIDKTQARYKLTAIGQCTLLATAGGIQRLGDGIPVIAATGIARQ